MQADQQEDIRAIFGQFLAAISSVEWMVQFWGHFLQHSLQEYISKQDSRRVFEAVFAAYNIPADPRQMWLWSAPNDSFSLTTDEMEDYRRQFFQMVMNLGYVKAYNALEMLLFQGVVLAYFPADRPPAGKNAAKIGDDLVKKAFRERKEMGQLETKNNRHLIKFLRFNSLAFSFFVDQPVRTDHKASWGQFFEMVSIIRNVNTHHGGLSTRDTLNELQSCAKEIFQRAFTYADGADSLFILKPNEGDSFLYVITLIKDFAVNSIKFMFDQPDLSFLGLHRC